MEKEMLEINSNTPQISEPTNPNTKKVSTSSNQNPNDMTPEEQAKYYRDLFTRSKKLIIHYEENMKTKDSTIKNLKDKLLEYEAGN
jgi:hypothetical protein